jgi:molybdate transport system substrate-binding protein
MPTRLTVISSMATRQVLADLATAYQTSSGVQLALEAVGGVDAARRLQAGEPFDAVVLAADAMAQLQQQGHVLAGSGVPLVLSPVAVAVKAGAPVPPLHSEAAVKAAVQQAAAAGQHIGYSTGPSGAALLRLIAQWGLTEQLSALLQQAPPGVPVATLVAQGQVVIGFQQLSELLHASGITVVGVLPAPIAIVTTFTGAVCATSIQTRAVQAWLQFMAGPQATATKQRHGMQAA